MQCQYCDKKVPLLRVLTGNQYCSEEHRSNHKEELNRLGLALLMGNTSAAKRGVRPGGDHSPDPKESEEFSVRPLGAQLAGTSGAL